MHACTQAQRIRETELGLGSSGFGAADAEGDEDPETTALRAQVPHARTHARDCV